MRIAALGLLALVAGCYAPGYVPCSIRCGEDGSCPLDTRCGAHGYCEREAGEQCPVRNRALAVGGSHACAIRWDGALWCWGANRYGALGNGHTEVEQLPLPPGPTQVGSALDWLAVTAGDEHTCAIRREAELGADSLYCWGRGDNGQLGNGDPGNSNQPLPSRVAGGGSWSAVSAGGSHTCGLRSDGGQPDLRCWGLDRGGQLGDGMAGTEAEPDRADQSQPVLASALTVGDDWGAISAGGYHTCGVRRDGKAQRLWCWGWNELCPLGGECPANPQDPAHPSPFRVDASEVWSAVGAGWEHTCGIAAGDLYCWGRGDSGQLGDKLAVNRESPLAVDAGDQRWESVAGGDAHSCGIRFESDGRRSLWCWGANESGQLGDGVEGGTAVAVPSPVFVGGSWSSVGAGRGYSCALRATDGSVWCWGDNNSGQLGSRSKGGRLVVPVPVL